MPVTTAGESAPGGPHADGNGALLMHHDAASVPAARRALVDALRRDPAATGVADEAAVIVSELLGNAVRHAQPLEADAVLLRWRVRPGEVQIEVVDGGSAPRGGTDAGPASRDVDAMATGGRGLRIIEVLSERWGSSTDPSGHRSVWACLTTGSAALARTA